MKNLLIIIPVEVIKSSKKMVDNLIKIAKY